MDDLPRQGFRDLCATSRVKRETRHLGGLVFLLAVFNAHADHTLGVQAHYTNFDDADFFGISDKDFNDDSDAGYGIYYAYHYSDLLGIRLGYIDHGEFQFTAGAQKFDGDSESFYLAWAPRYILTSNLALNLALGLANNEVDIEGTDDDDTGFYACAGFSYRFTEQLAIGLEVGGVSGVPGDIDPFWSAVNLEYRF